MCRHPRPGGGAGQPRGGSLIHDVPSYPHISSVMSLPGKLPLQGVHLLEPLPAESPRLSQTPFLREGGAFPLLHPAALRARWLPVPHPVRGASRWLGARLSAHSGQDFAGTCGSTLFALSRPSSQRPFPEPAGTFILRTHPLGYYSSGDTRSRVGLGEAVRSSELRSGHAAVLSAPPPRAPRPWRRESGEREPREAPDLRCT